MKSEVKNFYDLARAGYTRKWVTLSILIGIAAGLGSIIFYWSLTTATQLLLGFVAGYVPPTSTVEGATVFTGVARPWILPILTAAGGAAERDYSLSFCSGGRRARDRCCHRRIPQ